jgi:hypothetical protein
MARNQTSVANNEAPAITPPANRNQLASRVIRKQPSPRQQKKMPVAPMIAKKGTSLLIQQTDATAAVMAIVQRIEN